MFIYLPLLEACLIFIPRIVKYSSALTLRCKPIKPISIYHGFIMGLSWVYCLLQGTSLQTL